MSDSNGTKPKKQKQKKSIQISDEERKRRAERMKKLREEGKVGPEYGKLGGRPRKPRASELIAQEAEKNRDKLVAVLKDAIDPNQPISIRLKALDQWVGIENKERSLEMQEEEHLAKMGREELVDHMAAKLSENPLILKMFMDKLGAVETIDSDAEEEVMDAEVVSGD